MGKSDKKTVKQTVKKKKPITKKLVKLKPGMKDENGNITPPDKKYWFKPGVSGNPAGRKKGPRLRTILRTSMEKLCSEIPAFEAIAKTMKLDPEKYTVGEIFVLSTLWHAARGKSRPIKEVWERIDGKVEQNVRITDGAFDALSNEQLDEIIEDGMNGNGNGG